jgi:hypothetical protein
MTRFIFALGITMLTIAGPLTALSQDSTIIVLDHAAGIFTQAYRTEGGVREAIGTRNIGGIGSPSITVRTSDPVKVVLKNYVNALWDARITTREFESADYELYQGLLDAITPYAVDAPLLLGIASTEREVPELATVKVTAFRDSIVSLRATTMWKVRQLSLAESLTPDEIAATRLFAAQHLGGTSARPRLRFLDSLALWYEALGRVRTTKEVNDLREQSKALLTKATQLERALIRLSTIGSSAEVNLYARSTWKAGVSATLTIASSEAMSFAGLDTTLSRYSLTVLPDPIVRPISALAVIYWSGADFASYSTERSTSGYIIRSAKDDISHWTQGLSFGLAWRFLDFRDVKDKGLALSVPELIVNPFDSFRGIGVGVGASYAFLKLSAGGLWIRNTVLDGHSAGDVLTDPAMLTTMTAYTPRFFISLGLYNVSF